jgi:hypothetical protein
MRRRLTFLSVVFGTAAIMFLAQSVEYRGLEYMELADALAVAGVAGSVISMVLAARTFRHVGALDVMLAARCTAGLPFLVDWLLRLNGTELNVHGFAILGYLIYGLGSESCAIALLIAVAVRTAVRLKRRAAA